MTLQAIGPDGHEVNEQSSYIELAQFQKTQKACIQKLTKELKNAREQLRIVQEDILPPKMEADGMKTITLSGIGRLNNNPQFRASVIAEHQPAMRQWLVDNGWEALVQETVNSSTFKSWVKERLTEGDDIPMEYINVHSFDQVVLVKA